MPDSVYTYDQIAEVGARPMKTILGLLALLALAQPASAALKPAKPASNLYYSVGVNIHPSWFTSVWGSANWQTPLIELGVKHTRSLLGADPRVIAAMQPLFAAGIKHCAMLHDSPTHPDKAVSQQRLNFLVSSIGAQNIDCVEGPNELNGKITDWAKVLRDYSAWMKKAVRAVPALNRAKLVAPSLIGFNTTDYSAVGNLDAYVGRSNLHSYPAGREPSVDFLNAIPAARIITPEPIWATEFGYRVPDSSDPLSKWVVTERAAAKYTLRALFDMLAAGFDRTYVYSLLNDDHKKQNMGLLTTDLRKRPAYHALKNLMALFADKKGPTPTDLDYTITGHNASTKQHLFQRSDGSHLLVLYQDVLSYNRTTFQDIEPAPVNVTITLPASASFAVYQPTFGAEALWLLAAHSGPGATQSATGTQIIIPVRDHVAVVKVSRGQSDGF